MVTVSKKVVKRFHTAEKLSVSWVVAVDSKVAKISVEIDANVFTMEVARGGNYGEKDYAIVWDVTEVIFVAVEDESAGVKVLDPTEAIPQINDEDDVEEKIFYQMLAKADVLVYLGIIQGDNNYF